MEWFKHSTGSHEDPDINDIWDEFGDSGYIMFFVVLEIYGREYNNIDDDGFLWLNLKYIARKCRKNSTKVMKFLRYCEEISRFSLKISNQSNKKIGIKIPKFIEISSNWTKRKKVSPTEVPTEAPTAKEVEVEKKKKKKKSIEKFIPPLLEDVKQYFKEKGYPEQSAIKAFEYYDAGNWKDATGKKVKNWKQKMIAVWFKDENKINQKSKTSSNQKTLDYQERKLQKELEEENARAIRKDL